MALPQEHYHTDQNGDHQDDDSNDEGNMRTTAARSRGFFQRDIYSTIFINHILFVWKAKDCVAPFQLQIFEFHIARTGVINRAGLVRDRSGYVS